MRGNRPCPLEATEVRLELGTSYFLSLLHMESTCDQMKLWVAVHRSTRIEKPRYHELEIRDLRVVILRTLPYMLTSELDGLSTPIYQILVYIHARYYLDRPHRRHTQT